MEEQRQRVETTDTPQSRPVTGQNEGSTGIVEGSSATTSEPMEDAILEQALAMSMEQETRTPVDSGTEQSSAALSNVNLASMSEEEQIAYAMQMSMADARKLILLPVFKVIFNIF